MWEPNSTVYRIHRLNLTTQSWVNVGPDVDARPRSSQDALWDGSKLYIVSNAKPSHRDQDGSAEAKISRFSYDSGSQTYSLDSDFPVSLANTGKTRAMVLTKDSNGKLWVTWTEDGKVMVNRTVGSDDNWGSPFVLPAQENDLKTDGDKTIDISSIVAFGGDKIGILWGNQNADTSLTHDDRKYFFSVHFDGDPDTDWQSREDVLPNISSTSENNPVADDHINLACDINNGTLVAALKTGLGGGVQPRGVVAKRDPNGTWTEAVVGDGFDDHTRLVVLYDSSLDSIYVFAKSGTSSPETIFMKAAHINNLTFQPGFGRTFFLSDTDQDINNATSTKQCVNSTTGLLVLASARDTGYYLHNYLALGGNATPVAVDDTVATPEDTPVDIDVTANDTDQNGSIDVTTVALVDTPNNGSVAIDPATG
ncbi:hypothetical protein GWN42_11860, partial [candidate division KSB1 bacterium]|nr:hypothetical protein [candidate division KSB1 bacterium]